MEGTDGISIGTRKTWGEKGLSEKEVPVSVVIATYGRDKMLKRAIRSVLGQTWADLEVIVVDDNTDGEYREKVKDIVSIFQDPRIILIQNQSNLGGAESRNVGIRRARGAYIAFLDDDDEYLPERIEKQLQYFQQSRDPSLALVYCWCVSVNEAGERTHEYKNEIRGSCIYEAMLDCIAATSQWMVKKEALEKVGYFSNVPCKQDSTVILKLLYAGYTLDRIPEILSLYYEHGGVRISGQGNPKKRIDGEEKLLALCHEKYDLLTPGQVREVEYRSAVRRLPHEGRLGRKEKERELLGIVLRTHPFRKMSLRAIRDYGRAIQARRKGTGKETR